MIDAFVEGVRSIVQVCHLVILVPVAMVVLAGRARWPVLGGAIAGVVIGGWIFMTRWLVLSDGQVRISGLFVIGALLVVGIPVVVDKVLRGWSESTSAEWTAVGLAAGIASVVTLWWRPCVGEELGEILTRAPDEPLGQLLPTIGFMLGLSIPLLAIGLAYVAWSPDVTAARRVGHVAAGIGMLLAASVVLGQHGEIVARLFEWSQ